MPLWCCQRRATQHHLADHELAVVLTERAFGGAITRKRQIGTARPLPSDAKCIGDDTSARCNLPLRLARQVLTCKACESFRLEVADMHDRRGRIDRLQACQRHEVPGAVLLPPIAGRLPALILHSRPAI